MILYGLITEKLKIQIQIYNTAVIQKVLGTASNFERGLFDTVRGDLQQLSQYTYTSSYRGGRDIQPLEQSRE